jgi:hypothetical protein
MERGLIELCALVGAAAFIAGVAELGRWQEWYSKRRR